MNSNRAAAVVIVRNALGELLTVWNNRYDSWTLPGGLVRDGELPQEGALRELLEETGLVALGVTLLYEAPVTRVLREQRGEIVHVFEAEGVTAEPFENERGCPVKWMAPAKFLELCVFREFYTKMSEACQLGWTS